MAFTLDIIVRARHVLPNMLVTFLTGAFIQTVGKLFRRHLRPFVLSPDGKPLPNKRYYDILCWIVTHICYDYMVLPFQILTFQNSLRVWVRLYVR